MIDDAFFAHSSCAVARDLIGKVLRRRLEHEGAFHWVAARIVETEAYYIHEKASHASLGRTPSREPAFMPPGTLYLYHSRAGDSLNVSTLGDGNAVLLKAGVPVFDARTSAEAQRVMLARNPVRRRDGTVVGPRPLHRLCAGQTLLCKALDLQIRAWTGRRFDPEAFFLDDDGYRPEVIVVARRLGIAAGRDEHLLYRYVDFEHRASATLDPLARRREEGRDYFLLADGCPDPSDEATEHAVRS